MTSAGEPDEPPVWVHVALERDSGGELALYVDEVKQADVVDAAFAVADTGESFRVGAAGDVTDGEAEDGMYFVGMIDEVRLSVMAPGAPARGEAGGLGRIEVVYAYNARNQLVTETSGASVKAYSYDRNGNVTEIVETADPDGPGGAEPVEVGRETMAYDELNRMLSYSGPRGSEGFAYRGAEWHRTGAGGAEFLYDGDNVLADISGGSVTSFYVTPFLDQNLSMTRAGAMHYYSNDGLGSVRTLTDSAGAVENRYDYLPFGGPYLPGIDVSVAQRYTYTGRERNPASDLMYYRYRQYDPRVGRFRGRDPWGYDGSRWGNVYPYVISNPLLFVDRYGRVGLRIVNVQGPDALVCGGWEWDVRFELTGGPLRGGYVIQEIDSRITAQDVRADGTERPCRHGCAQTIHFWEAWSVGRGSRTPWSTAQVGYDDRFRREPCHKCSRGRFAVSGTARYYEDYSLGREFENTPLEEHPAGGLPHSKVDPPISQPGSNEAIHTIRGSWDCPTGLEATQISAYAAYPVSSGSETAPPPAR